MSGRQILATLLAVVAALSAVAGASAWWVRDAVIDRAAFADRAVQALGHEPVRAAVRTEITAQVAQHVPSAVMSPTRIGALADTAIASRGFRRAVRSSAGDLNDALFSGDGSATLSVDLAAVMRPLNPTLAAALSGHGEAELLTVRSSDLPIDTGRAAGVIRTLAVVLPALACFALAGALLVARDRRRALVAAAIAATVVGALLLGGLALGRSTAVGQASSGLGLDRAQARAAAGAIWDVYTGGLRTTGIVAVVAGLVAAAIAVAAGAIGASRRPAPRSQ